MLRPSLFSRRLVAPLPVLLGVLVTSAIVAPSAFAAPPTVVGEGVVSVTPFEAHLEAMVNAGEEPTGKTTECHFEYGKTSVSEHKEVCEQGDALEGGEQGAGKTVTGLTPKTLYHYRVVVKNATGEAEGAGEFTTLTLEKPEIKSESVTSATASDPRVEAVVNPNYQQTTYYFQYASSEEALLKEEGATVNGAPPATPLPAVFAELPAGPVALGPVTPRAEPYYYRVVATNATGTSDGPPQSFVAVEVPAVTTGETQEPTQTSAKLSGAVTPLGLESSYQFEYVSEAGYQAALAEHSSNPYHAGTITYPSIGAGSSYEPQPAGPLKIEGLAPGTTYHYALVAQNNAGITVGQDATFTTQSASPSTPPTATTGGASNISQNTATLTGTVDTNSLQTEYGFEIATEPGNYGPATGLGSIGGATTEGVSVTLGELQPATTYYYRITATNADGTVHGEPGTLTTPGFPMLLTAPSSPPPIAVPNIAFPKEEKAGGTPITPKTLTNAKKLSKALKTCKRDKSKNKRQKCERQARARYRYGRRGSEK